MGVALTSCTVPAAGKPTFELGDDEMEMGVGIHGEPGRRRVKLQAGRRHRRGDGGRDPRRPRRRATGDALLLVNGFGGTPLMELYLMYNARAAALEKHGRDASRRSLVGNYVTSLDMAGCSLTVTLLDDEIGAPVGRAGPHAGAALGYIEFGSPGIRGCWNRGVGMAKTEKGSRSQAEERFDRARKTNDEAMSIIDIERDATRKKTARLRKLRLARDAEAALAPVTKKPATKKKVAAARKK